MSDLVTDEMADKAIDAYWGSQTSTVLQGDGIERAREQMRAAIEAALSSSSRIDGEADAKPTMWFVKDFADGWIAFDNEADALREVNGTGAMLLLGYQFPASPHPLSGEPSAAAQRFAAWVEQGPSLAKAAGCYAGIRITSQTTSAALSGGGTPQLETKPVAFEVLDHVNGAYVTTNEQAALATEFPYNGLYRRAGALKP